MHSTVKASAVDDLALFDLPPMRRLQVSLRPKGAKSDPWIGHARTGLPSARVFFRLLSIEYGEKLRQAAAKDLLGPLGDKDVRRELLFIENVETLIFCNDRACDLYQFYKRVHTDLDAMKFPALFPEVRALHKREFDRAVAELMSGIRRVRKCK